MDVVVKAKINFNCLTYYNIVNIAYDGTNYVLTDADSNTYTYAAAQYFIQILFKEG